MSRDADLAAPVPLSPADAQRDADDRRLERTARAETAYLNALASVLPGLQRPAPRADEEFVVDWTR